MSKADLSSIPINDLLQEVRQRDIHDYDIIIINHKQKQEQITKYREKTSKIRQKPNEGGH